MFLARPTYPLNTCGNKLFLETKQGSRLQTDSALINNCASLTPSLKTALILYRGYFTTAKNAIVPQYSRPIILTPGTYYISTGQSCKRRKHANTIPDLKSHHRNLLSCLFVPIGSMFFKSFIKDVQDKKSQLHQINFVDRMEV
jgi:hypothetical protein